MGEQSLPLPEVIKLLYSKGIFDDTNPKAEKKFRDLLKEGKIPQAYKESGRWKIGKSSSIQKPLNNKVVYIAVASVIIFFFSILKLTNYYGTPEKNDNSTIEKIEQNAFVPEIILDTIKNGLAKNIYSKTKKVESEGEVKNYQKEGLWKFYYDSGVLKQKTYYKNNQKNGVSENYTGTGLLKEKSTYQKNVLHGKQVIFFDNGNESDVYIYKDGKKNGLYLGYDFGEVDNIEKHFIIQKGNFKDDLKDGEWKYYDYYFDVVTKKMGGKLILANIINYKDGLQEGKDITFEPKEGWILIETYYKKNLEHGIRKSYCPDGPDKGKLYTIQEFEFGKSVKRYPYQCDCNLY